MTSKGVRLGKPVLYVRSITSTQDVVRDAALRGAPEGFLVVAEQLECARGRMGRPFYTARGGLYFSLLLRPKMKVSELQVLPLALGVAVAESIEEEGIKCGLKWPNDCLINSKKVCGVLLESTTVDEYPLYVVAGVGLNANIPIQQLPVSLRSEATTLLYELGRPVDLGDMLHRILAHFEWLYDDLTCNGPATTIEEWSKRDLLLGKIVRIEHLGKVFDAQVKGVTNEGLLIVQGEGGLMKMSSADITVSLTKQGNPIGAGRGDIDRGV